MRNETPAKVVVRILIPKLSNLYFERTIEMRYVPLQGMELFFKSENHSWSLPLTRRDIESHVTRIIWDVTEQGFVVIHHKYEPDDLEYEKSRLLEAGFVQEEPFVIPMTVKKG